MGNSSERAGRKWRTNRYAPCYFCASSRTVSVVYISTGLAAYVGGACRPCNKCCLTTRTKEMQRSTGPHVLQAEQSKEYATVQPRHEYSNSANFQWLAGGEVTTGRSSVLPRGVVSVQRVAPPTDSIQRNKRTLLLVGVRSNVWPV